jgi:hypothetical protein
MQKLAQVAVYRSVPSGSSMNSKGTQSGKKPEYAFMDFPMAGPRLSETGSNDL